MPIDTAKAVRWMKRERKALKDYIEKQEREGFPRLSREDLAGYIVGARPAGAAIASMRYLASWLGATGCLRVLEGDEGGFADLDLACVYGYWVIRLLARGYDANPRPDKQPRAIMENVATCWMHAEAIGLDEIRDWLGARILSVEAGDRSIEGKDMNELCALMAHFITGHDEPTLRASGWAPLGPYRPVAARSLTPEGYEELAVYHTRSVDGPAYPAFHFYPYRLAPFELLAIEERTGVPIGERQHPLLTSPLATRRQAAVDVLPDELAPVIERMRSMFDV